MEILTSKLIIFSVLSDLMASSLSCRFLFCVKQGKRKFLQKHPFKVVKDFLLLSHEILLIKQNMSKVCAVNISSFSSSSTRV